ncbi:MAG: hypothetical protein MUP66_02070 [Candidatus Nanohaloarchaeota archaeon QJJ-5]|nr:hypothetical protein [Candidatus Nanohaloarchaeota archaeon QJJ-5]
MGIIERVFSDKDWRHNLDPEIARKLEKLLKRIKPFEDSYKQSRHESIAQLWVALAEVYIQVDRMNRRLIRVEKLLTEAQKRDGGLSDEELSQALKDY